MEYVLRRLVKLRNRNSYPLKCPVCKSSKVSSTKHGYRCNRCGYTHKR